ncbi:hypothetical protein CYMTET_32142 [Cymbomonas tetramitiformis]|uniref:Bacterial transcriptional activator domain-containing protein n=2 Tax=Cymbomonas tetramitiformis TaxID=36881 RepID=A0AAE0KSH4_9CHLO|nr:hypothetical protein CYMTET_32142 [Cymbomonas tetramitiformis]
MSCSCGFELYGIPPKGTVRKSPLKASREPRARHFVRSAYDSKKSSKRQQGLVFSFQNPRVRVSSSVHSAALPGGRDLPNDDKTREEEVSAKSESELKKSVDAALRRGSFEEFLKVLQLATSRGANLNRVFRWRMMRPALELCVRQGSVNQGLHVAGALGPKFEMAAVNIFADAYAQAGRHQQVRQLLDSLASQPPLRADERTYVALIKAYSRDGRADLALKVPKEMAGQRLEVNVHVYCALLNATAKDVATAQQVFQEMQLAGCTPGIVAYNTMLKVHASASDWDAVKAFWAEMQDSPVTADVVTYTTLISACAKCEGEVEDAFQLLERMRQEGLKPNQHTWSSLIMLCCRNGQVRDALATAD